MATARIPQPTAEDPVKVDPRHYKVEFENERVRVLRIKYGPGEKSVMHSHPESITVFLNYRCESCEICSREISGEVWGKGCEEVLLEIRCGGRSCAVLMKANAAER
jgi:hypothetical protein